ncbi:MAG: DNA-processing protein DprA [Pseudomonadota bacterium]|jgi:DNA processing protein|nr:DNA-protecting protein DprA [Rubrivivax sp.]MCA3259713.1 DNA-protecting protein DprA [Rubrivivax sp.]MCE2911791.1 DNA-processing protein DprA [Rubrivivax sp.]MCZ8032220.1 DNA-processing protein DprA [Rubrivivax sp.]
MAASAQPAPEDFEAWFRLLATPGVGRVTARRLLAACGSPDAVLRAPRATLQALAGAAVAHAVGAADAAIDERLVQAQRWLAGGPARSVLTLGDPAYPARLLQTADPPLMLYVEGALPALSAPALAIVGSRSATAQGLDNARAFAAALGRDGLVVVSGLALGIDAAAHEGALAAPAGTVAVLGTGLEPVYPPRHAALARRIAAHGALLSENPPGTPPLREHFPQRNRIIAGMTLGTLVVEAAVASGSLITARQAAEAGREVFAIPGSIHSPQARGCHALIKQGAKLVESAADILDELRGARAGTASVPSGAAAGAQDPAASADPLLQALGHDPVTLDALQARTGCSNAELNARLLELELDGRVARLPGGLFQRRSAG